MKRILFTTTALVAFAGAAAADGHVSFSWSGTATAGVARAGGSDATAPNIAALAQLFAAREGDSISAAEIEDDLRENDNELYNEFVENFLGMNSDPGRSPVDECDIYPMQMYPDSGALQPCVDICEFDPRIFDLAVTDGPMIRPFPCFNECDFAMAALEGPGDMIGYPICFDTANAAASVFPQAAEVRAAYAQALADGDISQAEFDAMEATLDLLTGTDAVENGDFKEYSEINASVTGTLALDNGLTLSATMSLDAGIGYDFADDDGFDSASTNGVSFDNIVVDAGAAGKLTFAPDDTEHLVDADDDSNADIKYENDFGIASIAIALDVDKDTNMTPAKQEWEIVNTSLPIEGVSFPTGSSNEALIYKPAVAADVQWSAKIAAPVADIATVYAAFDEEGGNVVGGAATVAGVTLTASSKLEALEKELESDRSNTVGASYTIGSFTAGAEYNTIDDGNQWSISGAYAQDEIAIDVSTNEGEEWQVIGSYTFSSAMKVEAGVNYTDDSYVGISFTF